MSRASLVNFLLFNAAWFATVKGAAAGSMWLGPLAFGVVVLIHVGWMVERRERVVELLYIVAVGVFGLLADTGLKAIHATAYPTSAEAWPFGVVPPWIVALWMGFATMPRFSLAWLARFPRLAIVLGGVGGALSFFGGTRMGAVAQGPSAWLTYGALAVEYAVAMPLMLRLAPAHWTSAPAEHASAPTEA